MFGSRRTRWLCTLAAATSLSLSACAQTKTDVTQRDGQPLRLALSVPPNAQGKTEYITLRLRDVTLPKGATGLQVFVVPATGASSSSIAPVFIGTVSSGHPGSGKSDSFAVNLGTTLQRVQTQTGEDPMASGKLEVLLKPVSPSQTAVPGVPRVANATLSVD